MYFIWIKEVGRNWRKLHGPYGAWESKEGAIHHAEKIAGGYVAVTVEDSAGSVLCRF